MGHDVHVASERLETLHSPPFLNAGTTGRNRRKAGSSARATPRAHSPLTGTQHGTATLGHGSAVSGEVKHALST